MSVFIKIDSSPETLGAFYVQKASASDAGVQYASTAAPPAGKLWGAEFADDQMNFTAGEEYQIGEPFDIAVMDVSYGALVVYDSDADGIAGGYVRYEISDNSGSGQEPSTFVSIFHTFASGAYVAIDVTVPYDKEDIAELNERKPPSPPPRPPPGRALLLDTIKPCLDSGYDVFRA
jgi:hypothetical protein